jgi:hypothetical protein
MLGENGNSPSESSPIEPRAYEIFIELSYGRLHPFQFGCDEDILGTTAAG